MTWQGGSMTEDELLQAVLDACAFRAALSPGDVYQHVRRSDRAILQGVAGLPDVLGIVGSTLLAWELKAASGRPSVDQHRWLAALQRVESVDARIIRPTDLDACVRQVLDGHLLYARPLRLP